MNRQGIFRIILMIVMLAGAFPHFAFSQRKAFGYQNLQHYDDKRYNFGFSLGVNQMNFALKPKFEVPDFDYTLPEPDFGFHIGIVSNLKLAPLWDLRFIPTLSFGDRYIEYYDDGFKRANPSSAGAFDPTLLEFPVHLKFKSERMTNARVYVLGGFKYSYDLASTEKVQDEDILVRIAKNDIHYEMGVGYDYYFYYFKLGIEVKASFGILNLVRPGGTMPDSFYNSIDRLNSKSIMVSFLFE